MILLTSKDYYTLKRPRTREHECVRQGKFACVPYINMFPFEHFSGIFTMKMNEQCVPYVHNSSYCFIPIVLKMYICPDHALKLCMWFEYNT